MALQDSEESVYHMRSISNIILDAERTELDIHPLEEVTSAKHLGRIQALVSLLRSALMDQKRRQNQSLRDQLCMTPSKSDHILLP